jgi:hypothetical protein
MHQRAPANATPEVYGGECNDKKVLFCKKNEAIALIFLDKISTTR